MKNTILLISILSSISTYALSQELTLYGKYQGSNLYAQNLFSTSDNDFCVKEIYLNNKKILDHIKASAFEINLSSLPLNENVTIRISHKENCIPTILNPEAITIKKEDFSYTSITVNYKTIQWSTTEELSKGSFSIEQYQEGNWIKQGEITTEKNKQLYSYPVSHQLGVNKYRIIYSSATQSQPIYSEELIYETKKIPITFSPAEPTDVIYLSQEANYEIANPKGIRLQKGHGLEIDVSNLTSGTYYLSIDQKVVKFIKK
jgi:hypothetical protein